MNEKNHGTCSNCNSDVNKHVGSIKSHLKKCQSNLGAEIKTTPYLILMLEGAYNDDYWLIIKAKPSVTLKKIDSFIRDIWVECCGHLSEFDGFAMSKKIESVFSHSKKINYIYDFGSSTELVISYLDKMTLEDDKNIQVLLRNNEIKIQCSECKKQAVCFCPNCIYEGKGFLCESCVDKHGCVEIEGEEFLLPVSNSPRMCECAYEGAHESDIKKYFPKNVICNND